MLERYGQRQKFTERVPSQMIFLDQLLHMLGCRASGTCLKQTTTVHQGHDGQHLGAGTKLQDREQISQIVAQHVAGDRDRVLALLQALKCKASSVARRHDLDGETRGVVVSQIRVDLLDQLSIVPAILIQPEDRRALHGTCTAHCQLHPISNRRVLHVAHAPDVTGFYLVAHQHRTTAINDTHAASNRYFEGLVVRAVLLSFLSHQTHIRHRAHGGWVKSAIGLAKINRLAEHGRIAAVWNDCLHILQLTIGIPHLPGRTNHRGHGCIDNDIAGHVQIGDAFV